MATNFFFALATTLKNLGAMWLSGKKKNSRLKKGFFGVGEVEGES